MKKLLASAIIIGSTFVGATAAVAATTVTPLVGYQFQTHATDRKQERNLGEAQRNHATYGLQVENDSLVPGTSVGLEYLRTDSNLDSYQVGFTAAQPITPVFYITQGLGYSKLSGDTRNQEGAYINVGAGAKYPLTNMLTAKAEVRTQYGLNTSQWTPVALVGLEVKTDQLFKPYSR